MTPNEIQEAQGDNRTSERRNAHGMITNPGGNAGKKSKAYRVALSSCARAAPVKIFSCQTKAFSR
ncbi:MAG: hypothetical protein RSC00_10215, partial [Ruthenibacterium sp.]